MYIKINRFQEKLLEQLFYLKDNKNLLFNLRLFQRK